MTDDDAEFFCPHCGEPIDEMHTPHDDEEEVHQDAVERLSKDLRKAAATLSRDEARFLVDSYYNMQEGRIRAAAQIRALTASGEPHDVLGWLRDQNKVMEIQIKSALNTYSAAQPIGRWMRSITGVGPVISSGLIAHIDIKRSETVSQVWAFAGLNPNVEWKKGEKRPWNAQLKVLCWKLGQSFMKVNKNPKSFYGRIYRERKAFELEMSDSGKRAETAAATLLKFKIGKDTATYKHYSEGKLPPSQIDGRARRYAVKRFLSHMHEKWRTLEGLSVREPYPIAYMGHTHKSGPDDAS